MSDSKRLWWATLRSDSESKWLWATLSDSERLCLSFPGPGWDALAKQWAQVEELEILRLENEQSYKMKYLSRFGQQWLNATKPSRGATPDQIKLIRDGAEFLTNVLEANGIDVKVYLRWEPNFFMRPRIGCVSVCLSVSLSVGRWKWHPMPWWSGAERTRAERSRAELSGAEQSGVERSGVERSGAEHSGAEHSGAEQSGA